MTVDAAPVPDVCIVGAGPVGIATALGCAERGLKVLLLESGGQKDDRRVAALSRAQLSNPARHAPMSVAVRRALGGTSAWWGGRCVPFDPIDFEVRPWVDNARWPVDFSALKPWLIEATDFFACGPAEYESGITPWRLEDAAFSHLERWAPTRDAFQLHGRRLAELGVKVLTHATVTDIRTDDASGAVTGLAVSSRDGPRVLKARHYVIACGGLETTRLLLNAQKTRPHLFGGPDGPLGRYYAGHISGKIADLVFNDSDDARHADFFLDRGVFARRRFTLPAGVQWREALLNTAFWIDNPPFHNPAHGNGALSLIWMALAIPPIGRSVLSDGVRLSHVGPRPHAWAAHLRNVFRAPLRVIRDVLGMLRMRLLDRPQRPGFLIHSSDGRYALHYHSEQTPYEASRVHLTDETDDAGVFRLHIDLRFREEDAERIVRAHEVLDRALRTAQVGHLVFKATGDERVTSVMEQAADGFHQTGLTRMSDDPTKGVVDADCAVHGIGNLNIASSSVFPTSGQANPTLLAVALGLRLAARLAKLGGAWKD